MICKKLYPRRDAPVQKRLYQSANFTNDERIAIYNHIDEEKEKWQQTNQNQLKPD